MGDWLGSAPVVELRHLRYFIAVAEELNFSRAAERLHMAQPPVSVAIRQLEQEIGSELFRRSSREVKLTEAGVAMLAGARRTLSELDRGITTARRVANGELGSLRVGFSWSARFDTLPVIGQAFRAGHPDIELLAEEMWNARMVTALRAGELDLAISLCPEIEADLTYETMRSEPVIALVSAHHPLAGSDTLTLGALAGDGFLLFPRELAPRLHDALLGLCRTAGFEPTIRSGSFHTGWELQILADVGAVALTPQSVGPHLPEGVVAIPVSDPPDRLDTSLVWRGDDSSAAAEAFRAVARTAFGTHETMQPQPRRH
jgi:DNA-binding transcriptional LysR family regulator